MNSNLCCVGGTEMELLLLASRENQTGRTKIIASDTDEQGRIRPFLTDQIPVGSGEWEGGLAACASQWNSNLLQRIPLSPQIYLLLEK